MRYTKKPIPVIVDFAKESGEMQTLEGVVRFQAGDALMTGISGERWPIARKRFEETYSPLNPPLKMGESGLYLKKPMLVEARQVTSEQTVQLPGDTGSLLAKPGDWILESEDGHIWVVADAIFIQTYQPA